MPKVTKIAISLPAEILSAVEKEREESGESRSRIFCRAVELLIHERKNKEMSEQYIRAYQEMPETEDEIKFANQTSSESLAGEPW
jgi:metal-responsive CopG/Arc/MetJ family transcriptional regulator